MKCHQCSKAATLHITEIVKGTAQELHLCEECARQYLESGGPPHAEAPAGESADSSSDAAFEEVDQLTCPSCDLSFREFRSQGRLGCAHCYTAFHDELLPLLENIHGEKSHKGKSLRRASGSDLLQFELIKLRNELKQAVDHELYEDAARIRDRIQEIESQLGQPSK